MNDSAHKMTRLFLVRCGASSSLVPCSSTAAKDLTFLELPRIPVATANSAESSECADALPRALVSPAVFLGRQSPFLSSALQNDRAWSRAAVEVTTWCIQGLSSTSSGGLVPVDFVSVPFAGVRVRLCGKGYPVCVVPHAAAGERTRITLTERGSYAWLQHGDILEFGPQVQVRLLAVHLRVSPAPELAEGASFVWVASPLSKVPTNSGEFFVSDVNAKPRISAVPTAMWLARLQDWSVAPKFLKSKMLLEAEQLTLYMQDKEARCLANDAAVTSPRGSGLLREETTHGKGTPGTALRVAPSVGVERLTHEEEAPSMAPRHSSESSHGFSAAAGEHEIDAATPTSKSQQQPRQQLIAEAQTSPSNFEADGGQAHNLSVLTSNASWSADALEEGRALSAVSLGGCTTHYHHSSGYEIAPRPTAPPPLRNSMMHRPSCGTPPSLATLSETVDDRLNEALLNLENGGNEVSDALLQRRYQAALLLGVMEEDLSGTRAPSSEELGASASQRFCDTDGAENRSSTKGNTPQCKRLSSKRGRPKTASCAKPTRASGRPVGLGGDSDFSQPLRNDIEHQRLQRNPTRAAIRRRHSSQQPQEDSQVVFFDH
ncbi:hypothetical protein JKF63_01883 [Porcisia hertigi]|uniref:Uncharacterized protein n=1 Tax=Porcisia hertigi TaxID=2761500 RepID=A0A836HM02_9TRYP|nr:hypothetical protein JKF63_01883 [Porcisia hertigi]